MSLVNLPFASTDQLLGALLAFTDQVTAGQRFVLAGLSYGGLMARGVLYHRAALIDGLERMLAR